MDKPACRRPAHSPALASLPQGGLEKRDISALVRRAAELATEAGQLPADVHNDHAFVVTAALQANSGLVQVVDFLPVSPAWAAGRTRGRAR